ncbi:DUF2591 family protein [Klebsiella aerogenes]|nr:DUF2591 family protein [Klebsiella aerogenes]
MDYSRLSDFEINRMVGNLIFKGLWACKPGTSGNDTSKWYYGNADTTFDPLNPLPDYCNDWSASGPIIVNNEISLNSYGSAWEASFEHDAPIGSFGTDETVTSGYEHRNPLRAAMIAYLMKQGQANA